VKTFSGQTAEIPEVKHSDTLEDLREKVGLGLE
jgi:hypothetical protein